MDPKGALEAPPPALAKSNPLNCVFCNVFFLQGLLQSLSGPASPVSKAWILIMGSSGAAIIPGLSPAPLDLPLAVALVWGRTRFYLAVSCQSLWGGSPPPRRLRGSDDCHRTQWRLLLQKIFKAPAIRRWGNEALSSHAAWLGVRPGPQKSTWRY